MTEQRFNHKIPRRTFLKVCAAAAAAGLTACGKTQAAAALPELTVGSDNYPPFIYLNNDSTPTGIDVDIATEAFARMGYAVRFEIIDWEQKTNLVESGAIDCIWSCFSMDGREQLYRWAGPYMYSRQVVIVQSSSDIYGLGDLNGKRIAVQTSSKPEELFLKHQVPGVEQVDSVYCFADTVDVFAALDKSYVDACAGHETAYLTFIAGRAGEYRVLEPGLLRAGLGAAFYKDDGSGRAEALNEMLHELVADGTVAAILESYGVDAQAALAGLIHGQ